MGTETCKIYFIFKAFENMNVKLNNPQMGTETEITPPKHIKSVGEIVKLNNPQMGTETLFLWLACHFWRMLVKLNNPQMGTETLFARRRLIFLLPCLS